MVLCDAGGAEGRAPLHSWQATRRHQASNPARETGTALYQGSDRTLHGVMCRPLGDLGGRTWVEMERRRENRTGRRSLRASLREPAFSGSRTAWSHRLLPFDIASSSAVSLGGRNKAGLSLMALALRCWCHLFRGVHTVYRYRIPTYLGVPFPQPRYGRGGVGSIVGGVGRSLRPAIRSL